MEEVVDHQHQKMMKIVMVKLSLLMIVNLVLYIKNLIFFQLIKDLLLLEVEVGRLLVGEAEEVVEEVVKSL